MEHFRKSSVPYFPFSSTSPDPRYAMPRPEVGMLQRSLSAAGATLLIEGPRRIGKTTLIRQSIEPERLLEINLYGLKSASACESAIGRAIALFIGKPFAESELRTEQAALERFVMVSRQVQRNFRYTIEDWFRELRGKGSNRDLPLVVFIDEVQVLAKSADGESLAARLRTIMQANLDLFSFVLAGSNSALLAELHASERAPFYKQLRPICLERLPKEQFLEWINARLRTYDGSELEKDSFDILWAFTRGIPGDVQRVLEEVVAECEPEKSLNVGDIEGCIKRLVKGSRTALEQVYEGLTEPQIRLLLFVAFRERMGLGNTLPMTGRLALKAMGDANSGAVSKHRERLLSSGILSHYQGELYVDNPFFQQFVIDSNPRIVTEMLAVLEGLRPS